MAKILIVFAHPALEKSRVHTELVKRIRGLNGITFHDLYEVYPDFDIDVPYEQNLLLSHDTIIFQHPFYWYSPPALIKQWQDLVLEHGWAYGTNGNALAGKFAMNVISAGGSVEAYRHDGRNRFTIRNFLVPYEQTVMLCKMTYLPPFVIYGTHRLTDADIRLHAIQYEQMLIALQNDRISADEWRQVSYMNELFPIPQPIQT